MILNGDDSDLLKLITDISNGDALLLLGAGASATSLNSNQQEVKTIPALARLLAEKGGFPYQNDDIGDILDAVVGPKISTRQFTDILRTEYTRTSPSTEYISLFNYTWRRIYTWNIDDVIENISSGQQTRKFFNALIDDVYSYNDLSFLQVIHLHGEASKTEHGVIFSRSDYMKRLNSSKADWYRQAAADYISHTPIFIGSRLNEPILFSELERARPANETGLGVAFLITPDTFTDIQLAAFRSRNIVIFQGTLGSFTDLLASRVGKSLSPKDIAKQHNTFVAEVARSSHLSRSDIDTANYIRLHRWRAAKARADAMTDSQKQSEGRDFLEGKYPSWYVAASNIPVVLSATSGLYTRMLAAIKGSERIFVAVGQSGSGKTTAIMQCLLQYLREEGEPPVYEILPDVGSLGSALSLIARLHRDEHVVVYLADAFSFGDNLASDVLSVDSGKLTIITSARSGEWQEHIERRIGDIATSFMFERFVEDDFPALISKLVQFVPAPSFTKLSPQARSDRLRQSKSQLLIALKEATQGKNFSNIISDEFLKLPDVDCKRLLLIAGLATLSRSGISSAAIHEAYNRIREKRSFDGALRALEGIVYPGATGRYGARHELYVRHIIENVAHFRDISEAIESILHNYTRFAMPIVRNVSRNDALLFKFLLNHNFISSISRRHHDAAAGLQVYRTFEIHFQLDGHFWLQYGQYLVEMGSLYHALEVLSKSIEAYPGNPYAAHALADVRLRVAAERALFDAETSQLMADAVDVLEAQHASKQADHDQYPIVTLSEKYVGALVKHEKHKEAKEAASRYFRELERLVKRGADPEVQLAKEKLGRYLILNVWTDSASGNHVAVEKLGNGKRAHRQRHRQRRS